MCIPDVFYDHHIVRLVIPIYYFKSFVDQTGTVDGLAFLKQWLSESHVRKEG